MVCFSANPHFATTRLPPLLTETPVRNYDEPTPLCDLPAAGTIGPAAAIRSPAFASCEKLRRILCKLTNPFSGSQPVKLHPAPSTPSCARWFHNARLTDETFRSESGDPVCRPIGFRYPAICLGYAANLWKPWISRAMLRVFGAARGPY
jgi:hypothetical protein